MTSPRRKRIKWRKWLLRHPDKHELAIVHLMNCFKEVCDRLEVIKRDHIRRILDQQKNEVLE